jgi:hypothetical protein
VVSSSVQAHDRTRRHSTHLLQPLDVGVFSAIKAHHQNVLYESIRFGDFTFDKTDFLDAFQEIHDKTMHRKTIFGGFKKTGLFPFNALVVLAKMRQFEAHSISTEATRALPTLAESIGQIEAENALPNRPTTPPLRKPFQDPPTTQTRESHATYLDQRITDHIDETYHLTPSYQVSLRSYNEYTVRKMTEVRLIEHHKSERQSAAKEKAKLRAGSSRYVQKSSVI